MMKTEEVEVAGLWQIIMQPPYKQNRQSIERSRRLLQLKRKKRTSRIGRIRRTKLRKGKRRPRQKQQREKEELKSGSKIFLLFLQKRLFQKKKAQAKAAKGERRA